MNKYVSSAPLSACIIRVRVVLKPESDGAEVPVAKMRFPDYVAMD